MNRLAFMGNLLGQAIFIFWGLWLLPLGYLVLKSAILPKILGLLLIIAGFGYLFEFVTMRQMSQVIFRNANEKRQS